VACRGKLLCHAQVCVPCHAVPRHGMPCQRVPCRAKCAKVSAGHAPTHTRKQAPHDKPAIQPKNTHARTHARTWTGPLHASHCACVCVCVCVWHACMHTRTHARGGNYIIILYIKRFRERTCARARVLPLLRDDMAWRTRARTSQQWQYIYIRLSDTPWHSLPTTVRARAHTRTHARAHTRELRHYSI
jgi:hypothetical protein